MPRVIEIEDDTAIGLDECCAGLGAAPFDPTDEDSLHATARLLRQLGNNRDFLADRIVGELADAGGDDRPQIGYGPQVVLLERPEGANCYLRANIWPSRTDHMMRNSGARAFFYGLPHDHSFHFLTLGYFGPGYWSDYYEADYATITGHVGERVALRPMGRKRLEEGQILHYRAHLDVHDQLPPDAMSVSINVMHGDAATPWLDQYEIEPDADGHAGTLRRIITRGAVETFLRIAVGLGSDEAIDLAHRFGHTHPSDRVRLSAWTALAGRETDAAARDAIWAEAERAGSRLVAIEAEARRAVLAGV